MRNKKQKSVEPESIDSLMIFHSFKKVQSQNTTLKMTEYWKFYNVMNSEMGFQNQLSQFFFLISFPHSKGLSVFFFHDFYSIED